MRCHKCTTQTNKKTTTRTTAKDVNCNAHDRTWPLRAVDIRISNLNSNKKNIVQLYGGGCVCYVNEMDRHSLQMLQNQRMQPVRPVAFTSRLIRMCGWVLANAITSVRPVRHTYVFEEHQNDLVRVHTHTHALLDIGGAHACTELD